ncbi:dihydropteroate synthase [Bacteroidia bacterium]|nr:dihydropteroate synthase [Bacteroidia bacterium]MDB9882383.1 dihydropteroate synthase [Bacteroidia bacterium]MDC1395806.1 dihydropteroate synthase [Bacteroidia bacterium]
MKRSIHIKGTHLDLSTPIVMGILNVTPDSFSDGGKYNTLDAALKQADQMLADGVSILDIGGYSSRPGAADVSVQEELDRVIGIIDKIGESADVTISIDTFRSEVAREAVAAGASIVNDISAGEDDPQMLQTVAELNVPYIAMHKQGVSKTMQDNPIYENVEDEVYGYLESKIAECSTAGIKDVIIDPGFGFGKTMEHNYALLRNLEKLTELDAPILVGLSRKSMIYKALRTTAKEALNGTSFLHAFALEGGASILRVHDVKEAVQCIQLYQSFS